MCAFFVFQFVAHPNIQQLLASLWYQGVPGFRRKTAAEKLLIIFRVVVFFPLYCMMYMLCPGCSSAKLMRKPFMKFLIHAASYLFFLCEFFCVDKKNTEFFVFFCLHVCVTKPHNRQNQSTFHTLMLNLNLT